MATTKVRTTVQVDLDGAPPQPVAAECPTCFALVIRSRLAEHEHAAHSETSEDQA